MRVAINAWFLRQPTTGSGQYLRQLLQAYLACTDHDFLICEPSDRRRADGQLPPLPGKHVFLRTPFGGRSRRLSKVWFEQVAFPWACRQWQADVAHVPYWAAPLLSPVPVVVTVHDLIPLLFPAYRGGVGGEVYLRLVSASARRATLVLTDSHASRRDIVRHLRIPPRRVRTVYLAVGERFHPPQEHARRVVACKYDLPDRYFLYLGGFDVRKNVPVVLRSFALLSDRAARLVIAGRLPDRDTPLFPDPRRIAAELGIIGRVRFIGWVEEEEKPAIYSGATALLFPSQYEGFGLPPLEAISCGTPVIVSRRGSLPEVTGEGGLYVDDPDDASALARAMERLWDDPSLRARLSRAGLAHAARFSQRHTAKETLAAYRHACDTGR